MCVCECNVRGKASFMQVAVCVPVCVLEAAPRPKVKKNNRQKNKIEKNWTKKKQAKPRTRAGSLSRSHTDACFLRRVSFVHLPKSGTERERDTERAFSREPLNRELTALERVLATRVFLLDCYYLLFLFAPLVCRKTFFPLFTASICGIFSINNSIS